MPNRMLRDWTDSKTMNALSWQEEVLFTRLIMKADDHGRYFGDSHMLKSLLFPRKDGLRSPDIDRWIQALVSAGLIRIYHVNGDSFLLILKFNQRLRQMRKLFPDPPENESEIECQPLDSDMLTTGGLKRREEEVEEKRKRSEFRPPDFLEFKNYFLENGFDEELAFRAFNHYQVADWHDSSGRPVKNWKQKAQSVWFKKENKSQKNEPKHAISKAEQASAHNLDQLRRVMDGTL